MQLNPISWTLREELKRHSLLRKTVPMAYKKLITQPGLFLIDRRMQNAEWRMQFLWPFKSPFLIIELDDEYSYTVIGTPSRKYVWIMSRDHTMPDDLYNKILSKLEQVGYDILLIDRIVQKWD